MRFTITEEIFRLHLGVPVPGPAGGGGYLAAVAAIETVALAREFEGGIRAVDGVDLEVAEGEVYGFLGPNGAGKTTTVRMLTTLLLPTSGRATVAGLDVIENPGGVRR